jgi:hypothetical protein
MEKFNGGIGEVLGVGAVLALQQFNGQSYARMSIKTGTLARIVLADSFTRYP